MRLAQRGGSYHKTRTTARPPLPPGSANSRHRLLQFVVFELDPRTYKDIIFRSSTLSTTGVMCTIAVALYCGGHPDMYSVTRDLPRLHSRRMFRHERL